jgi:hypothetical protein
LRSRACFERAEARLGGQSERPRGNLGGRRQGGAALHELRARVQRRGHPRRRRDQRHHHCLLETSLRKVSGPSLNLFTLFAKRGQCCEHQ